jgi:hypothetical protein
MFPYVFQMLNHINVQPADTMKLYLCENPHKDTAASGTRTCPDKADRNHAKHANFGAQQNVADSAGWFQEMTALLFWFIAKSC